jgi:DNA polymerase III alpha subunit (gram-positive type)
MSDAHIFFDVESTGLGKHSDIIQIGAVHQNGRTYKNFIIRSCEIKEDATRVNGFTTSRGRLYRHYIEIRDAVSPHQGLNDFLDWVWNNSRGRDVLIAHNCFQFDAPVLINNILNHNVEDLAGICRVISGFGDTLESFRERYPNERFHSQASLMRRFEMRDQSHDALDDADDLMSLVQLAAEELQIYHYSFITSVESTRNIELED